MPIRQLRRCRFVILDHVLMVLIWNLTGPVDKTARPSKRTLHVEAEGKAAAPHQPSEVRPLEVSHALGLMASDSAFDGSPCYDNPSMSCLASTVQFINNALPGCCSRDEWKHSQLLA